MTCGCCTSPGSTRQEGSRSYRWCRCNLGRCACGSPRGRTRGGCTRPCASPAVASDRGSISNPTPTCCCSDDLRPVRPIVDPVTHEGASRLVHVPEGRVLHVWEGGRPDG